MKVVISIARKDIQKYMNIGLLYGVHFPGRLCPGLIEADISAGENESALAIFRGVSAPASMKLDHRRYYSFSYSIFRGVSAPASLKPTVSVGKSADS